MQRKRMSRGAVVGLINYVFIAALIVVVLIINWSDSSPTVSLFDTEQYYQGLAEQQPPARAPSKPDPGPLTEAEPPPAVAPLDVALEKAPELFIVSQPVRMRIPALELDYQVQGTGADDKGTMQIVPALDVISWFKLSAIPGNRGNAIFGGHNAWSGVRSPIFILDELEIGDEMFIDYADGTSMRFLLESVFVYLLRTAPADLIMDVRGEPRVTLITCKWPFNTVTGTSDYRIVAIFKEEHVFVIPDPPIEPFPPRVLN